MYIIKTTEKLNRLCVLMVYMVIQKQFRANLQTLYLSFEAVQLLDQLKNMNLIESKSKFISTLIVKYAPVMLEGKTELHETNLLLSEKDLLRQLSEKEKLILEQKLTDQRFELGKKLIERWKTEYINNSGDSSFPRNYEVYLFENDFTNYEINEITKRLEYEVKENESK